jgi:NADPH:quinone reductase-like Zn-dependent oxidoreductase
VDAFVLTGFGAPAEHRSVPDPVPGAGEVRVRVAATSVNPVDDLVRLGFFRAAQEYRFPAVFGRDLAGTVDAVGPGVDRFREGDEVYGFVKRAHIGDGTFAELVVVPEDQFITARPRTSTLRESGTLGLAGVTALECVAAVQPRAGAVVVINGATGGLGTFAVQIAKAMGARVVATARSADGARVLDELGADAVVDPRDCDLVALVRAEVPQGASGLLDFVKHVDSPVMGAPEQAKHEEFARLCLGILAAGGRAASVTNGGDPGLLDETTYANVHSTPTPETLGRLARLVDEDGVRPVIAADYSFAEIESAFQRLTAGGVVGKLAVSVAPIETSGR